MLADSSKAALKALSPASLASGAKAVAGFVADLYSQQLAYAATVAAPQTAFPMALLLMVVAFLAIQNRIDRNDPKLALAPVYADRHLGFGPPLPGGPR